MLDNGSVMKLDISNFVSTDIVCQFFKGGNAVDQKGFGCGRTASQVCDGRGGRRRGRMLDQGMLRYVVLKYIGQQPRHGYDLIKILQEQSGGVYSPSPGMIYPMLSMLEDLGYVSVASEGSKKLYQLTSQGQDFLAQNQELAQAIENRLSALREQGAGRVRAKLHALRDAVHERLPLAQGDSVLRERMVVVLEKALAEIQAL